MKNFKAKPCPFCGWPIVEGKIESNTYFIQCKSCKARTKSFQYWADAVNAWNKRAKEGKDDV